MNRDSKTIRLKPDQLAADLEALNALKAMAGYAPGNPDVTVAKLEAAYAAMLTQQVEEDQAKVVFDTKRDAAVRGEHTFHSLMNAAYDAVRGQFGRDSDQVQAMGRKKISEYKRPAPRKKPQ